ncbi:hypothetical protein DAI22_12g094100 [Oryza sativa Japonica Group]|nr:hypothetical protein DAI22_12g094100 [Oryza sativa Japonica Group]
MHLINRHPPTHPPSSPLLSVASVYSPLNPPTATLFLPPLSGNGSGGGGDALEKAVARGRGRQIRRLCRWGEPDPTPASPPAVAAMLGRGRRRRGGGSGGCVGGVSRIRRLPPHRRWWQCSGGGGDAREGARIRRLPPCRRRRRCSGGGGGAGEGAVDLAAVSVGRAGSGACLPTGGGGDAREGAAWGRGRRIWRLCWWGEPDPAPASPPASVAAALGVHAVGGDGSDGVRVHLSTMAMKIQWRRERAASSGGSAAVCG